ncbi:MAG TPA: DNA repair protein RadA [Bacteroidota bacterium]|nr:DNA repair protein RadA [Bacteroidota bacterium]
MGTGSALGEGGPPLKKSVLSRPRTVFVCQACAYESPRWTGRCPNCETWNTLVEEIKSPPRGPGTSSGGAAPRPVPLSEVDSVERDRIPTGIGEFDRVLGGGIVPGSVTLLGGDPGIGKSTLMMQLAAAVAPLPILYVSGEESPRQIKLRAERLGFGPGANLLIFTETNADVVADVVAKSAPGLVVVDSIQTMYRPLLDGSPGSVAQVRESAALLTRAAKDRDIPLFLIGHVTKDGFIAGPKVIEHMVDTVIQFEGDRHFAYRILRASKNRFGSTNEIGVFEMRSEGLREVLNPSEVFLSERSVGASGSTVVAALEGTRPILVEVQALVSSTNFNVPQRNTTGFDYRRLGHLLAVLEKRLGMNMGGYDVFVNIAGGVRIDEPGLDLGIAASIISSMKDVAIASQTVVVGEIGLGGEVRSVGQIEKRIQEAEKLGFEHFLLPQNNLRTAPRGKIALHGVDRVEGVMEFLLR